MTNVTARAEDGKQSRQDNGRAHIATDFIKQLFEHTDDRVFLTSLGNERDGRHYPKEERPRDDDDTLSFVETWNRPERGMFFCVSTIKGQTRNKSNASEIVCLHADIDLKDVDENVEGIEKKLLTLADVRGRTFQPSLIVRSGNGVHAYWLFKEPISIYNDSEMKDRIEDNLRVLADLVGGDLAVCEVARLMRLPGSHNSKRGAWTPVTISHQSDMRYELDDLEGMLSVKSPVILRKIREVGRTVGQAVEADPYLAYFQENGLKPRVDVKKRLDQMMYMAQGEASVHETQIAVTSSMLSRGHSIDEVVELLMAATKLAAGSYGKRWNWPAEERAIRKDAEKWLREHPPKDLNPIQLVIQKSNVERLDDHRSTVDANGAVRKPKSKLDNSDFDPSHVKIGGAVISAIQARGDDIIFTERASWFCDGGIWRMTTDGTAWLNVEIQKAIVALGFSSTMKLRNEARTWIQCQDRLCRRFEDIPWDEHGMVPTRSGLVNPRTLEVRPIRPDDYCTWLIDVEYDPNAECPWWLQLLADAFADREPEERGATIAVIQELLGAGMIDKKPREISRATVFLGASNCGKSVLLEVMSGLFGQEFNTTPIEALEGAHGKMGFIKRRPWVLHEAFDQRKWHFSADVKTIITREPIYINIKNGPVLSMRSTAPVFWGTNHPPQFKESTKAIINRLVVIECRREFFDDKPVGAAVEARKRGLFKPSDLVLMDEMPGVLAWAMRGLKRALERGRLLLTKEMTSTMDAIRADSNLVDGFLADCVIYDCDYRVSVPDFCLAFAAWFLENKGENRSVPSNEVIGKALKAMADPKIASGEDLRDKQRRYHAGIALNPTGLAFHQAGHTNRDLEGKTATATDPSSGHVNERIPAHWLEKESIKAMRRAQVDDDDGKNTLFPK